MVSAEPAPLSFTALNSLLRNPNASKQEVSEALTAHKDTLVQETRLSQSTSTDLQHDDEIRYRKNFTTSRSHPTPTASELSCIQSIRSVLRISQQRAALLLRDYLHQSCGDGAAHVLSHCADLTTLASVDAVENFRRKEKRSAFSCLVVIYAGASQRSTHSFYGCFKAFLEDNSDELQKHILNLVLDVLGAYRERAVGKLSASLAEIEGWWVMEVLFASCLYRTIGPLEKEKLLLAYSSLIEDSVSAKRRASDGLRYPNSALDGVETTALFAASLNISNGLGSFVSFENDSMDSGSNEQDQEDILLMFAQDVDGVGRVNEALRTCMTYKTAEASLLSFSWATALQLCSSLGQSESASTSALGDPSWHMSSAVSANVFGVLRSVSSSGMALDEQVSGALYQCFWTDVVGFLLAFPPQHLNSVQAEEVVTLAISLLSRTERHFQIETAESLWEREGTADDMTGANSLLRLASGVYPQTFRPLIVLLKGLTVSENSTRRALKYIANHLCTLAEQSDAYQNSLLVLEGSEESSVLQSLAAMGGTALQRGIESLSAVCPADEEIVYVQAGDDLPRDSYRPQISRGTVGISDRSLSVVTWVVRWNGLHAVDHILRVFLRLLREHKATAVYEESVLIELLSSVLECLTFFDRLSRAGSRDLRESLLCEENRVITISNIVGELCDPGDWAKGSWLTRERRESLLTAAASCVSSLTVVSISSARRALERINSTSSVLPLHSALTSLGAHAFPAVAAISRIASSCCLGENLSESSREKLVFLSRSRRSQLTPWAFDGDYAGAARVYKFLRAVALPLWLTISPMQDVDPQIKSLRWLLPACCLHLFSKRPKDVLEDPAISSVLVRVLTAAAGTLEAFEGEDIIASRDVFLFPALRGALLACYEALRERNSILEDRAEKSEAASRHIQTAGKGSETNLTALEKLLLKPDSIHALAVMSSGCAERLKDARFYSAWRESEFRSFVPEFEADHFLLVNFTRRDVLSEAVCSWRAWVEDMCARCLSLQFGCLSQLSHVGDVIQVPWPSMAKSSFSYWRGGGEMIRKGYAERIRQCSSVAATELIVSVIACGQRAAARSLLGPHVRKRQNAGAESMAKSHDVERLTPSTAAIAGLSGIVPDNAEDGGRSVEDDHEILSSIVFSLRECRDLWVIKVNDFDSAAEDEKLAMLRELGHTALMMSGCVRFLRLGWESNNGKWFQESWNALQVWEVLSSLLRCEGGASRSEGKVDLALALDAKFDPLGVDMAEVLSSLLKTNSVENIVTKQSLSVDVVTAWKAIVADCLNVFSFEILYRASEAVVSLQAASNDTEQKENKIYAEVFGTEPFVRFASVFTERWMHVLIPVDENILPATPATRAEIPIGFERKSLSLSEAGDPELSSIEQRIRELSRMIGKATGLTDVEAAESQILHEFRRTGDTRIRFGSDYAFDVQAILEYLKALKTDRSCINDLVLRALQLNTELSRSDVHVEIITAFSGMAAAALFADSFAPSPPAAMTYSSPQFGGKVCRFFSRVLICIKRLVPVSGHASAIATEIARVMANLSTKLSQDELDQAALTSMRFIKAPAHAELESTYTPLGQICAFIGHMISSKRFRTMDNSAINDRMESVRWLLLASSKMVYGTSFSEKHDIAALASISIDTLRIEDSTPSLCTAASVAMVAVLENVTGDEVQLLFNFQAVSSIFGAIARLATFSGSGNGSGMAHQSASSLLLVIARIYSMTGGETTGSASFALRQLSGGSVLAFLPSSRESILTYESNLESRNSAHVFWCAAMQLASVVIPDDISGRLSATDLEQNLKNIVEFGSTYLLRIARDSLDLSGDWPPMLNHGTDIDGSGAGTPQSHRHLTIGRVAEAEIASKVLLKLAGYAPLFQEKVPDLYGATIAELMRFTYQVYRLIRAEPLERWVRPVTQRERERSHLLNHDREPAGSGAPFLSNSSPPNMSPSKSLQVSNTPPQRSPSQALRAAIGGGSGRVSRFSPGLPPSPGMPPTPQQYASSPTASGNVAHYASPGSSWGPYGSGLITGEGLYFSEEASRSLLRGVSSALAALRHLSEVLDASFFEPSMVLAEGKLGLGVLVALQYHACNEVYRGAEGERRDLLQTVIDNALHLTVTQVMRHLEKDALPQAMRDELRKRLGTVRLRMQTMVPPAPSYSIIHSPEFEAFLRYLKHPA